MQPLYSLAPSTYNALYARSRPRCISRVCARRCLLYALILFAESGRARPTDLPISRATYDRAAAPLYDTHTHSYTESFFRCKSERQAYNTRERKIFCGDTEAFCCSENDRQRVFIVIEGCASIVRKEGRRFLRKWARWLHMRCISRRGIYKYNELVVKFVSRYCIPARMRIHDVQNAFTVSRKLKAR